MARKHVHKYERVDIGVRKPHVVYRCALPDCPHYLHSKRLLIGKRTICWRCGHETVIDAKMAERKKPHCRDCSKTSEQIAKETRVDNLLASLGFGPESVPAPDTGEEETDD